MGKQQSALAQIQEKVATGKELVRPSDSPDLAVNVSRIKSTIGQMDAFKGSLNSVNDRLRIEESYIEGSKDILIKMKQLTLQGSNGSLFARDREVIALEIDELIAEMKNLANGTDANGNFLFAGSRVATMPYAEDAEGVIRYQGDNFRPNIDYTANRRSPIGRNGLDVFKPVLSGEHVPPTPGVYSLEVDGTIEAGDTYTVLVDGVTFQYAVRPGDDRSQIASRLAFQINEATGSGQLSNLTAVEQDGVLEITATDGVARAISAGTENTRAGTDDLSIDSMSDPDSGELSFSLSGTMDAGDQVRLTVGTRSLTYHVQGDEGGFSPTTPEAVIEELKANAEASGLFSESVRLSISEGSKNTLLMEPLRDNIGQVLVEPIEHTAINDQALRVELIEEPRPAVPERVEFFESLQEISTVLRTGTQDQLQGKLDHLDQMLDIVTLSLADIGAEMNSIDIEIGINEDLKLQLESTLSSQEDLDYSSAITEMQAKMMSLEAAQSSFAKISQLSVFDYIR